MGGTNPNIAGPFGLNAGGERYTSSQLDALDRIYQAIVAGSPTPPITANTAIAFNESWVIDQAGVIHWMTALLEQDGDLITDFYDSPGGTPTTPTGLVSPTSAPLIAFKTIRLDGDSGTQTAVAWQAPTSGTGAVVGSVGREYVITPGFRHFQIVATADAQLNSSFTLNGVTYTLKFGDYAGTPLPFRGDPGYLVKIDEQYTIVAATGCTLEITEVR